ncbi:erv26 super protein, partial [Pichia californica]
MFIQKLLSKLLILISIIQFLLLLFDSFPFKLVLFSLFSNFIYNLNLKNFQNLKLSNPIFLLTCLLSFLNHYLWFNYFNNPYIPTIDERLNPNFISPYYPSFTEIASFFAICIWLFPFALFISISSNENGLPVSSVDDVNNNEILFYNTQIQNDKPTFTLIKKEKLHSKKILLLKYLPNLEKSIIISTKTSSEEIFIQIIDKDNQLSDLNSCFNENISINNNNSIYLFHEFINSVLYIFYQNNNNEIKYTTLDNDIFTQNSIYNFSNMFIYQFNNNNLEQFELILNPSTKIWNLKNSFIWNNNHFNLIIDNYKIINCSNDYLIASSFFNLIIINKSGNSLKLILNSLIINSKFINNNLLFFTTDNFEIYYLYLNNKNLNNSNLEKLNSLKSNNLSIVINNIHNLNNFIFLSNNLSGFYIFNKKNLLNFNFLNSEISSDKEINLFNGISYVIKNEFNDEIISFTDGYNSILSLPNTNSKFNLNLNLNLNLNHTLLAFSKDLKTFITKFNSKIFINYNEIPQLLNSDYIIVNNENNSKYFGFTIINKKLYSFSYILNANNIIDFHIEISVQNNINNNNKSSIFTSSINSIYKFNDGKLINYPSGYVKDVNINFKPLKLLLFNDDNNDNKYFILFNSLNISIFAESNLKNLNWNLKNDPIIDIPYYNHNENEIYISTLSNKLYKLDLISINLFLISINYNNLKLIN